MRLYELYMNALLICYLLVESIDTLLFIVTIHFDFKSYTVFTFLILETQHCLRYAWACMSLTCYIEVVISS